MPSVWSCTVVKLESHTETGLGQLAIAFSCHSIHALYDSLLSLFLFTYAYNFPSLRFPTAVLDHLLQILVNDRKVPISHLLILAHHLPIHALRQLADVERRIDALGRAQGEDEVLVRERGEEAVGVVAMGGGGGVSDLDVRDGEVCLCEQRSAVRER